MCYGLFVIEGLAYYVWHFGIWIVKALTFINVLLALQMYNAIHVFIAQRKIGQAYQGNNNNNY